MKLGCRVFGHDGADFWVPVSHTTEKPPNVEVRRCYRCGDVVEQRDVAPRKSTDAPPYPWPPLPPEHIASGMLSQ